MWKGRGWILGREGKGNQGEEGRKVCTMDDSSDGFGDVVTYFFIFTKVTI